MGYSLILASLPATCAPYLWRWSLLLTTVSSSRTHFRLLLPLLGSRVPRSLLLPLLGSRVPRSQLKSILSQTSLVCQIILEMFIIFVFVMTIATTSVLATAAALAPARLRVGVRVVLSGLLTLRVAPVGRRRRGRIALGVPRVPASIVVIVALIITLLAVALALVARRRRLTIALVAASVALSPMLTVLTAARAPRPVRAPTVVRVMTCVAMMRRVARPASTSLVVSTALALLVIQTSFGEPAGPPARVQAFIFITVVVTTPT